ncbi:amino acid ABC transporter substrate-binding protein [uncultured Pseudoalteromonas sp.]|uniref:amino acid ABC transporter substrate-binding protein n=1 Tax=uncultured Pseudoalteromonas sp. TaxID=114053 RepID=UPI0030C7A724
MFNFLAVIYGVLVADIALGEPVKKYVVGVENIEYLPYYDGSGKNKQSYYGFSRELLELFAKQHKIKFEFYTLPIPRLYKEFIEHQHVDFKYPDNPNWHNAYKKKLHSSITYSEPSIITHSGIASLKPNITFNDCKSLAKVRGFTLQGLQALTKKPALKLLETDNVIEMIYLLFKERIDCIYISRDVLEYNLSEFFDTPVPVYFQHQLPVDKQAFLLSTVNYPSLAEKFSQFLQNNEKKINALKSKHKLIVE